MQIVTVQDYSAAFFATGNVAISKHMLNAASRLRSNGDHGPFDTNFSDYGWEDLELGGEYRRDCAESALQTQQGIRCCMSELNDENVPFLSCRKAAPLRCKDMAVP